MSAQDHHVSELALDEVIANLSTARARAAAAHLQDCPHCQGQLAALRQAHDAFLARFPHQQSLPRRATTPATLRLRRPRWQPWLWAAGPALVAASAVVLFAVQPPAADTDMPKVAGVRVKGGTIVEIAVGRGSTSSSFVGQPLRAGDRLAFRYTTTLSYLMVVSLESSGEVSIVLPASGQTSIPIEPGRQVRLPEGMELDDYPEPERLVALFSAAPLRTDVVKSRIMQAYLALGPFARQGLEIGNLGLPAEQLSWLLEKDTP